MVASASVTFVDSFADHNSGASSITVSGSITTGSNLILICNAVRDSSGVPTGITWNSVAMTKIADQTASGLGTSIWFLANPDTGTHNAVATWSGTNYNGLGCVTFSGADQNLPTNYTANKANTVSVTTTSANSMLVAGQHQNGHCSLTGSTDVTIRIQNEEPLDDTTNVILTRNTTSTGAYTIGTTGNCGGGTPDMIGVEIAEASAGGGGTPATQEATSTIEQTQQNMIGLFFIFAVGLMFGFKIVK